MSAQEALREGNRPLKMAVINIAGIRENVNAPALGPFLHSHVIDTCVPTETHMRREMISGMAM